MNKFKYLALFLITGLSAGAQDLEHVLLSVERNNPQIQARQKWLEAEQVRSRTGLFPDNPEVTYNYLWGNNEITGDQTELEIIQPFRFPGYYTTRSDVQQLVLEHKRLLADKVRLEVLYEAELLYFDLVWIKKREILLERRLAESSRLVSIMRAGFEREEISRSAYDKAQIYHLNIETERQKVLNEIEVNQQRLQQLNGGLPMTDLMYTYPNDWTLPQWDTLQQRMLDHNPDVLLARQAVAISEKNVKLEKMKRLPEFEAGYKAETILNQQLRGIHGGITIPLWENSRQVEYAKTDNLWTEAAYQQIIKELIVETRSWYLTAQNRLNSYNQMQSILDSTRITEQSFELLQAGHLSFPEYLVEVNFIFESENEFLLTEKQLHAAMSELRLRTARK